MKRHGNLYGQIISIENLEKADEIARRGKKNQDGVKIHDKNKDANIKQLHEVLLDKSFNTSAYKSFPITDPKERIVYALPYFPDRIVHHAIMNVLEPIFVSVFNADTYSCIKGRGVHRCSRKLREVLKNDVEGTACCLKLDIKKFYPSVDHFILKTLLRRKIKCADTLTLLDEIIDSAPGVPIGNYLSQYFANLYLAYFDHWLKEEMRVKYYFRYADDIVILSSDKDELHLVFQEITRYLNTRLLLEVKRTWRIFPTRLGIDFCGYVHFHTHTRLRKSIKKRFAKSLKSKSSKQTIAAYNGWVKHCDSKHLMKKLLRNEKV